MKDNRKTFELEKFKQDHRKPFGLITKDIPTDEQYKIQYSIGGETVGSYIFKSCNSNLLIDIDNDNAKGVANTLEHEKIDVNDLYVIPSWEIPEMIEPAFQTFLHRALWEHSENVFDLLLKKGANPRIKGYCHSTVIDDLFDGHTSGEDIFKFGKMLVDAGVKAQEIKKSAERRGKTGPYTKKLIHYAETKKAEVSTDGKMIHFFKQLGRVKN